MIHQYKNAKDMKENARVLVVGSGLSAMTVASELKIDSNINVSIACGRSDDEIQATNSHSLSNKPKHMMQLMPSQLSRLGIFNFGRVVDSNGKDIVFESKGKTYSFYSSFFSHIILAVGFEYSFRLFENFPEIGVENNLPKHNQCRTAVVNLFVAGIVHRGQQDRVVTITQGTRDARIVHGYITNPVSQLKAKL